ncbi:MAG TPA: DUF465 domain-containing protein [Paracoccaceae bacterium]|nr:DUF465 domain-containing protein [Paracoccaceae bacterium]
MSLSSHLVELRRKHESLAQIIEEEARHPSADQLRLTALKREKLKLKDEIARLSQETH